MSNQPAKVYPALVVETVAESCTPVLVVVAVTEVPELVSKVTFNVFAFHLANSVKFAVLPCVYGKVTTEPVRSALSNQPTKAYPALVLVIVEVICPSVLTVVAVTAAPPLVSKATESVLASHLA